MESYETMAYLTMAIAVFMIAIIGCLVPTDWKKSSLRRKTGFIFSFFIFSILIFFSMNFYNQAAEMKINNEVNPENSVEEGARSPEE